MEEIKMGNLGFLKRLLGHKGPVFLVHKTIVSGTDQRCPQCSGKGSCEAMRSDDAYSQWTETVTCKTCRGTTRVSITHEVLTDHRWHLKVTSSGVELSTLLRKPEIVYFNRSQAETEVSRLNSTKSE
jgi:hypothetical protein